MTQSDFVRRTIVVNHARMIDGNVGSLLFEVAHGISTSLHQPVNKRICIVDSRFRIIYEPRLDGAPFAYESFAFIHRQLADVVLLDSLLTLCKHSFAVPGPVLADCAIVFRPETLAQSDGSSLLRHDPRDC